MLYVAREAGTQRASSSSPRRPASTRPEPPSHSAGGPRWQRGGAFLWAWGSFPRRLVGGDWEGACWSLSWLAPLTPAALFPAAPNHSPHTTAMSRFAGAKQLEAIGCRRSAALALQRPPAGHSCAAEGTRREDGPASAFLDLRGPSASGGAREHPYDLDDLRYHGRDELLTAPLTGSISTLSDPFQNQALCPAVLRSGCASSCKSFY